jgi:hypothetical protein
MSRALGAIVAPLVVVALLTCGDVAGASVPAKPSKFCKAVKTFDTSAIGNPTTKKGAARTLKQLRRLEAAATGNLQKAIATVVHAYEQVADGKSARSAMANSAFVKAAGTFALAAGKCFVSDLPDITLPKLPDLTLPR